MTPAALLLLGMDAVRLETGQGVARAKWVARALVEELAAAMPPSATISSVLDQCRDPQVGVSDSAIARATNELLDAGFLEPRGIGDQAIWAIVPNRAGEVSQLWSALAPREKSAFHMAAQRTLAMSVAWSNRRRASLESRRSTSRSGAALRQPRPRLTRV